MSVRRRKTSSSPMNARERQQEAVARLGQTALLGGNIDDLMEQAVSIVAATLGTDLCKILELLPGEREFLLRAGVGWPGGLVGHARVDAGLSSQAGHTLVADAPVIVTDLRAERRFTGPPLLHEHGVISGVSVIILGEPGRPYGVLGAHSRTLRQWQADDVNFLQAVANIVAAAVQRKRNEERLARLARIVESSHDAIIGKTLDGIVTEWNHGAERIYGYTANEMVGRSITTVVPSDRTDELPGIYERVGKGQRIEPFETVRIRKDGQRIHVLVTISPVYAEAGQIIGCSAIARDISERIRVEEQLKELTATLEHRVEERTRALLESQDTLRKMSSELTLAELRERRRLATELHDYLAQMLVVGRLKVGHIRSMLHSHDAKSALEEIDDILDKSLTYTRTLVAELSPTVLYEFGLAAALQWLGGQMQRNGLSVAVKTDERPIDLPEDQAVLIYQTVRELLLNVVKHARVDRATVELGRTPSNEIRVVVADQGQGFNVEEVAASQASHTKFGLFSIRERLQALGARFEIQSAQDCGTRAIIIVPTPSQQRLDRGDPNANEAAESADQGRRRARSQKSLRVLLVDDHAMVRQGLRSVLEESPTLDVVGEADNGPQAIELAGLFQPDVVVMDINLPQLNGVEVTRRILRDRPSTRVIGISVNEDEQVTRAILQAGAEAFIPKGRAAVELVDAVHRTRRARSR